MITFEFGTLTIVAECVQRCINHTIIEAIAKKIYKWSLLWNFTILYSSY